MEKPTSVVVADINPYPLVGSAFIDANGALWVSFAADEIFSS